MIVSQLTWSKNLEPSTGPVPVEAAIDSQNQGLLFLESNHG
jgi:hypothetical protein